KATLSLIAAEASDGMTLRATKSSQFLNLSFARASTIALERAGPMCGSLSSSSLLAVLRLVLAATGGGGGAPVVAVGGLCGRGVGRGGHSRLRGLGRLDPLREGSSRQQRDQRRGDENATGMHVRFLSGGLPGDARRECRMALAL